MNKRIKAHRTVLNALLWTWTGTVYFFIEVAWKTLRGRPDTISWTMLVLALILAIPLERCGAEMPWHAPLWLQGFVCGMGITAAELLAGLVLNVWLGLGIWDYSGLPFNLAGQICLPFFGIWCLLSMPAIVILDWLRYAVEGGERPHYSFFFRR